MRVLFTENIETYRLPKHKIDLSTRKIILATLAKYLIRSKKIEPLFAVPQRLYKTFLDQAGPKVTQKIIITDEINSKYKNIGKSIKIFYELLDKTEPEVIVTTNVDDICSILSIINKKKIRKHVIWQDRDRYTIIHNTIIKTARHIINKKVYSIVARNLQNKNILQNLLKRDIPLIPVGIDTEIFKPSKNNLANREWDLLFVGRASHEKGIDRLVRIIKKINKITCKKIKVRIITNGGPLENQLKKIPKIQNIDARIDYNIKWSKMKDIYSDSKILISTSHLEIFGQAMAEALACNCIVYATNTPGSRLIRKYVKEGIYIIKKTDEFAKEILKTLDEINKKKQRSPNPRKYIQEKLSGEAIAKKWETLFLKN